MRIEFEIEQKRKQIREIKQEDELKYELEQLLEELKELELEREIKLEILEEKQNEYEN